MRRMVEGANREGRRVRLAPLHRYVVPLPHTLRYGEDERSIGLAPKPVAQAARLREPSVSDQACRSGSEAPRAER